jgi:phospholipid transport system substrate-binding protein
MSKISKERTLPLLAGRRLAFRLTAGTAVALLAAPAFAASPAADLVSATVAEGFAIMKSPNSPQRQAAIKQILMTKFDLPFMAQTALGKYWDGATAEQKQRFVKATEESEAKTYNERFGQYSGLELKVVKTVDRPNGVQAVDTRIIQQNGSQPLKLEWEVRNTSQGLRITDVKVEGVSMVVTRRSDFNSYIQQNGGKVDALIEALEAKAKGP